MASLQATALGLLLLFFIFVPLERLFPLHRQRVFRRQFGTDVLHLFVSQVLVQLLFVGLILLLALLLRRAVPEALPSFVGGLPVWAQFLSGLVLFDLAHYWAHRMMHAVPRLWRFHEVHHAIAEMDWLASVRLHPVDQAITKALSVLPLLLLGYPASSFAFAAFAFTLAAFFVHANLRFRFGPLKYLVMTPEFHHWHHADVPEAYNKNLASLFPWIDALFGTLYLPRAWPGTYGVSAPVPPRYLGQLAWPFRRVKPPSSPPAPRGRA